DLDAAVGGTTSFAIGTRLLNQSVRSQKRSYRDLVETLGAIGIEAAGLSRIELEDMVMSNIGRLAEMTASGELSEEQIASVESALGMEINTLVAIGQANIVMRNALKNQNCLANVMTALGLTYEEGADNVDQVINAIIGNSTTAKQLVRVNAIISGYAKVDMLNAEKTLTDAKDEALALKEKIIAAQGEAGGIIDPVTGQLLGDAARFVENEVELVKRFGTLGSDIARYVDAVSKAQKAGVAYAMAKLVYDSFKGTEAEEAAAETEAKPWLDESKGIKERITAYIAARLRDRADAIDAENIGGEIPELSVRADGLRHQADMVEQAANVTDVLSVVEYAEYRGQFLQEVCFPVETGVSIDESGNPVIETTNADGTVTQTIINGDIVTTVTRYAASGITV
ncbi:MAG: hypothetical protein Q8R48_01460, partial [Candidatus Omnitrophota bacterium]|nr:hypothetical protein [Candidatus Omnitrophota bacterium]